MRFSWVALYEQETRILLLIAIGVFLIASSIGNVTAGEKRECGDMKWSDKDHDTNNPSKKKFLEAAYEKDLCDLAKGIDHEKYHNHVSVDWNKFKQSPAYLNATDDQQDCLKEAHHDGNGMNGLGGYEILYCGTDND